MIAKFRKFLSFLSIISKKPSLINLILNDNTVRETKFRRKLYENKGSVIFNL
jgi:hypothetical protein